MFIITKKKCSNERFLIIIKHLGVYKPIFMHFIQFHKLSNQCFILHRNGDP